MIRGPYTWERRTRPVPSCPRTFSTGELATGDYIWSRTLRLQLKALGLASQMLKMVAATLQYTPLCSFAPLVMASCLMNGPIATLQTVLNLPYLPC